ILPAAKQKHVEQKPVATPSWLAWLRPSPAHERTIERPRTELAKGSHSGWGIWAAACIVAFIALVIVGEDFAAQRAWEKYQQEAGGNGPDFMSLVPPPVPDDQNFAMTPLLAPMFESDDSDTQR